MVVKCISRLLKQPGLFTLMAYPSVHLLHLQNAMKENQVLCMIPQVFIYNSEPTKSKYWASLCHVNCPHSLPLLVGAGITGSTAVGTSALIVGNKSFKELSAQVNTDLDHWEKSYILSRALAKVAVQN